MSTISDVSKNPRILLYYEIPFIPSVNDYFEVDKPSKRTIDTKIHFTLERLSTLHSYIKD